MNLKEFLRPTVFKMSAFLLIGSIYLYFAKEDVCAVSFYFGFCYRAYGFPFQYIVTGDIAGASSQITALPFSSYFTKYGSFLLNVPALVLDVILIYLMSCFISILFRKMKFKR